MILVTSLIQIGVRLKKSETLQAIMGGLEGGGEVLEKLFNNPITAIIRSKVSESTGHHTNHSQNQPSKKHNKHKTQQKPEPQTK